MNYESLKTRQRAERSTHHPNMGLRVHRALSWLHRAELQAGDTDGQFVFLWISFNAAYATEIDDRYRLSEQATFCDFLAKLIELDGRRRRIEHLVWNEFSGGIRVLLENRFVFQDFWASHNGSLPRDEWKERFARANQVARNALGRRDTVKVLSIVLSRIYTLRNQLMHGGATWNSSVNRDQVRDCTHFMEKLVPALIEIMLDHPSALWGDACYPVVE